MKKKIDYSRLPIYEITCDEDNQGIRLVSLTDSPAIEEMGMTFNKEGVEMSMEFKTIKDKQIIVGPAMIADKKMIRKDEDGNYYWGFFSKETIKKMVYKFNRDNNNRSINLDHTTQMVKGHIQENWIVEDSTYDKSRLYGYNLPIGSWFISVKIDDSDFWNNEVKMAGKFGFSIEGTMGLVPEDMNMDNIIDEIIDEELEDLYDDIHLDGCFNGSRMDFADTFLVHPNCGCHIDGTRYVLASTTIGDNGEIYPCELCINAQNEFNTNGRFKDVFGNTIKIKSSEILKQKIKKRKESTRKKFNDDGSDLK